MLKNHCIILTRSLTKGIINLIINYEVIEIFETAKLTCPALHIVRVYDLCPGTKGNPIYFKRARPGEWQLPMTKGFESVAVVRHYGYI